MANDVERAYVGRPVASPESVRQGAVGATLVRGYHRFLAGRVQAKERQSALTERAARFRPEAGRIAGMMTASHEQAPPGEDELIHRLMESFLAAKAEQPDAAAPYQPGAEWARMLDRDWAPHVEAFRRNDVDAIAEFARNFFRNDGLNGYWENIRPFDDFVALDGPRSIGRAELMQRQLDTWRDLFPGVPTAELAAPAVGNPWGYLVDGQLIYEPVCEYHYHASYVRGLLRDVPSPVVLEIGGGFGGLAYQLLKGGAPITYIGLDLPESVFLQSYYLACTLPGLRIMTFEPGIETISAADLAAYDVVLVPNFALPRIEDGVVDLALNVRSLSEMPAETIAEYLHQLDRISRLFVFHENIYKARTDGLHGIPSSQFPELSNFLLVSESESRWPRYDSSSGYPCHENLYLHRSVVGRG